MSQGRTASSWSSSVFPHLVLLDCIKLLLWSWSQMEISCFSVVTSRSKSSVICLPSVILEMVKNTTSIPHHKAQKYLDTLVCLANIPFQIYSHFASIITTILLGRPSIRFCTAALGISARSIIRALARSGTDVRQRVLALSQRSNSSQWG